MTITCDPRRNIVYIRVQEKAPRSKTIRVSDALNVDIAPDGIV